MARFSERLKDEMARVLTERKWSRKNAEIHTGVSTGTIQNMAKGSSVGPEFIIKWAEAIEEDPDDWLAYAGYRAVGSGQKKRPAPARPAKPFNNLPGFEKLTKAQERWAIERFQEIVKMAPVIVPEEGQP